MRVSRLQELRILLEPLHRTVAALLAESGRSPADRNDVHDLYKDLGYVEKDFKELRNESDALEFERFRIRPFLQRTHQTLLREHVTLAKPALGWPEISCDPSAVSFAGAIGTKSLAREACKLRHLKLLDIAAGFGDAGDRWDRLRSARIAVFDLSAKAVDLRASVYHELGASIALGQYPVVLALEGQRLPFDVDFQQVEIGGRPSDLDAECMALDKAFFSHLRRSGRSSFDETIEQLKLVL
ncbi:MAG: hypothetical protein KAV87_22530 [Desulfobacteraceae bacterium]|nr:hypothetical protein [Desulfobacteraceae bacterium]